MALLVRSATSPLPDPTLPNDWAHPGTGGWKISRKRDVKMGKWWKILPDLKRKRHVHHTSHVTYTMNDSDSFSCKNMCVSN